MKEQVLAGERPTANFPEVSAAHSRADASSASRSVQTSSGASAAKRRRKIDERRGQLGMRRWAVGYSGGRGGAAPRCCGAVRPTVFTATEDFFLVPCPSFHRD